MIDHLDLAGGSLRWKSLIHDGSAIMPKFKALSAAGNAGNRYLRRSESREIKFWPSSLPISGPSGASCTGVPGYLWLFVWSNPTQLKVRLAAHTFKPTLWHLRGLAAERRTQLLLWNVIWLIDFRVASLVPKGKVIEGEAAFFLSLMQSHIQVLKWTCCNKRSPYKYKISLDSKYRHLCSNG